MSVRKYRIADLFNVVKGTVQSSKNTPGDFCFITAAEEWKTHNEFTHDEEALVFAAAASGSLGRTHYVTNKFIASDLCFVLTAKNVKDFPINIRFYHFVFNSIKDNIVNLTKSGTSKESINLNNFSNFEIPYFDFALQTFWTQKIVRVSEQRQKLLNEIEKQNGFLQSLRQSIVQDAVQGKLVPEGTNYEHASELLKRIKLDREKQVKAGISKKGKPLPPIKESEIPFELPEGWIWCRFGDVVKMQNGFAFQSSKYSSDGVKLARNINISHGRIDWSDTVCYPNAELINFRTYEMQEGDIVLSLDRPIISSGLKVAQVLKADLPCLLLQRVGRVSKMNCPIRIEYIYIWFNSPLFIGSISPGRSNGVPHISTKDVERLLFPMPPIEMQDRIVLRVREMTDYCNRLDKYTTNCFRGIDILLQAVLKEAFENSDTAQYSTMIDEVSAVSVSQSSIRKSDMLLNIPDSRKYFAKQVLAGKIISLHKDAPEFSHIKFQKVQFLAEHIAEADLDLNYYFQAAGPYDPKFMHTIGKRLQTAKWFEERNYKYIPLDKVGQIDTYYNTYFSPVQDKLTGLFEKLYSFTEAQCEIIATLYAVWNNMLIKKETVSEAKICEGFYNWSDRKQQYTSEQLAKGLAWMKANDIIPTGFGKEIKMKKGK